MQELIAQKTGVENLKNLDAVLNHLDKVKQMAKVNFYSSLFKLRPQKENFSINMPEPGNVAFLGGVWDYLNIFKEHTSKPYNPVGESFTGDTYEYIYDDAVSEIWLKLKELIGKGIDFNEVGTTQIQKMNLFICLMEYDNARYYIFMKQEPTEKLFKGKTGFLPGNDGTIKPFKENDVFFVSYSIGFIISEKGEETTLFVFNRKFFGDFFKHDEHLRKNVREHEQDIKEWGFLDGADKIVNKIDKKYVYQNLSKIINDDKYCNLMKTTKPLTLKKRILSRASGVFSEDDFNEKGLLIVTESNIEKVIKMIVKGFKYNFFEDKAEE